MLAQPPNLRADVMRGIALDEMARGRRRLGELSPEQERALQSLMVSVADTIYGLVSDATRARGEGAVEGPGAEVR